MAQRMILVPEDQRALAYQKKLNISPQLRSLSDIDALMNRALYMKKIPAKRRMRLYNQLSMQKQDLLRQIGDEGIRPTIQIASCTKKSQEQLFLWTANAW